MEHRKKLLRICLRLISIIMFLQASDYLDFQFTLRLHVLVKIVTLK